MILMDIGKVVKDQQFVFIELRDSRFQLQCLPRLLQFLHEVGRSGEQYTVAVLDERATDCCCDVTLAGAGRAKAHQVGSFLKPSIASGKCCDACLAQHRHRGEVEVFERLAGWQTGLDQMALDPTATTLRELQFGQGGEKPGRWPSLFVGAFGELRP